MSNRPRKRRKAVGGRPGTTTAILIGVGLGMVASVAGMLGWLAWNERGEEDRAAFEAPAPENPPALQVETAAAPPSSVVAEEAGPPPAPAVAPPPAVVTPHAAPTPPKTDRAAVLAALPAPAPRPPLHGTPAWRRNAVAVAPAAPGHPRIAIVIDDLGPNLRGSQAVISLPGPLTLAFLPYADVSRMVEAARRAGHEILVHMPMEPMAAGVDPGPGALKVVQPKDELRRRIDDGVSRFPGHVGLNNHMGSRFTADPRAMAVLMDEIAGRGLLFLDSRTTVDTVAEALARARSVPFVSRDVFLDNDQSADKVVHQLAETERVARRKGYAVAIGHPHAATRAALAAWLPQAAGRGFQIVPISSLARVAPTEQARH
ncbi:hypothetical protein EDC65_0813 [Stella humosa]|uniref:Divergent polysaccharide deacetylase family protein n=1 Tax=Stella humosa TaxID=94 RepID=A0A3N1MD32_9PROT|nr:divergent polysaccharide deacetylase family protein [Stella humosa]ROQ01631.1 hypothetical protein EDC65_0813 [Stella humosa]BBK32012.1 hypothetical protein STHU_26460 [Stella humosa]